MTEASVIDGAQTSFGSFGGGLKDTSAGKHAATATKEVEWSSTS